MSAQHMSERNETATIRSREGTGVVAFVGRLLLLACVLLGFAGDALAVYSPRTGRFLQKDPNESGMLHAELWHEGEAPMPALAAGSLHEVHVNGSNLFASVGNRPFNATDPTGLFYNPLNPLSTLSAGVTVGLFAEDLVSQYNQNLEFAIEWALDPTMDPDWLNTTVTPNWSVFAPALPFEDVGQAVKDHLMGGAAGAVRHALKIGGKIARRGHWHHIIPRYLAQFTRGSDVLVRLPKKLHASYHRQLDYALRAKGAPHMRAPTDAWTKWVRDDLGGNKELAKKIVRETLERETKRFGKKHDIPDLYKTLKQELDLIE